MLVNKVIVGMYVHMYKNNMISSYSRHSLHYLGTFPYYTTVLSPWQYRPFNIPLFVPLPTSYTVALLILALVGINLYICIYVCVQ